jgi:hypothetical protein
MRALLARWVRLWDLHERADTLAVIRIGVALVVLWDFAAVAQLGLVAPLWAPIEEGGIGPAAHGAPSCWFYERFGASAFNAGLLFSLACISAASLCIGFRTRASALVLLLVSSQLAQLSPGSDRGIDTLLRNVLMILVFAQAGATLSVDARLRTGGWISAARVPAWPRYLIVLQLVVMYFSAGMHKQSQAWTSLGGYSALYLVLHQPHFAAFTLPHEWLVALRPLLRASTFVSVWFERLAILVPWLLWLRATRDRAGRVRAAVNRMRLLEIWIALGLTFHLGLSFSLLLGIFPWGCIALYPAFFPPETLRDAWTRLELRLRPAISAR